MWAREYGGFGGNRRRESPIASGTTSRRGLSEKEVQERVQWRCLVRHKSGKG